MVGDASVPEALRLQALRHAKDRNALASELAPLFERVASAVDCIVAQRLARKLCTYCKRQVSLSAESVRTQGFEVDAAIDAFEAVGCARCNYSGYKGRIGLYEVMLNSDDIRELTIRRSSADEIRKVAIAEGMTPLRNDGLDKVRLGITSIEEVLRVA